MSMKMAYTPSGLIMYPGSSAKSTYDSGIIVQPFTRGIQENFVDVARFFSSCDAKTIDAVLRATSLDQKVHKKDRSVSFQRLAEELEFDFSGNATKFVQENLGFSPKYKAIVDFRETSLEEQVAICETLQRLEFNNGAQYFALLPSSSVVYGSKRVRDARLNIERKHARNY